MASLTTSSLHYLTSLATETGDVATSTTQASGPSYTGDPVSYDDGYYRSNTPMVYPFTTSSFPLALTTAILFLILTILHAYLCFKKKTVFFAITIYASLAMATSQTMKCYLVQLQTIILHSTNLSSSTINQLERADVVLVVMDLLEAIPASAMGFLLMMTYTRLTWFIIPKSGRKNGRVFGLPARWQTSLLALGQMVGDGLVGVGHYYGLGYLQSLGGVVGLMTWGVLGGLVVRAGRVEVREEVKEVKRFVWAVGGAVGLLIGCATARIIRREAVAYFLAEAPWWSSEYGVSETFAMSEWPVYVFQHLPILLILVLMAVYHPGAYLPRRLTGWRLNTKKLLREERMREDVENLKVLARKDSKALSVQGSELDCFERVDLDKETK
ncbi:uncharacterized protein PODANS_1_15980 [Podospora anserina S mat+]|uniref:Podospora anserina S mat+ genomic DNA chromosome 1, supercontig 4 n=1 Tax=Podospora anserina (strain S / ATCC MYA-4624 / DSM 980 / FGSC 10383) TaxID=515849 RepID=B2ATI5_PODAN|nr:uncharacterized protein PODANS_1_15980 [Podospora anserina S mat+]CAP67708.1 unnamed protein product [Podospora anserina S mat+]CDP23967.1 Putative protein of unknown function [Podospora anserina S mat+]